MDEPPYTCETSEIMNKLDMGEIPATPAKEQGHGPLDAASCSALEALDYAIYTCNNRAGSLRHEAYNAACRDIILFLEVAKGRLLAGEGLYAYAVTQNR